MPITDITNKILTDASKEAEGIIKNAEIKASEILGTTKISTKRIEEEYTQRIDRVLAENKKRVTSVAEQEVKLGKDSAKRIAIDATFEDTLKQLLSLSDKEYEVVILTLLKELQKNVPGKIIAPRERKCATESALKKAELKYDVETTNKFKGGFIFLGENFESNFVFEEILRNKKNALEVKVAQILFS